jgi:hypothetical protein
VYNPLYTTYRLGINYTSIVSVLSFDALSRDNIPLIFFKEISDWLSPSILWNTPKRRRNLETRQTRKFGSKVNNIALFSEFGWSVPLVTLHRIRLLEVKIKSTCHCGQGWMVCGLLRQKTLLYKISPLADGLSQERLEKNVWNILKGDWGRDFFLNLAFQGRMERNVSTDPMFSWKPKATPSFLDKLFFLLRMPL